MEIIKGKLQADPVFWNFNEFVEIEDSKIIGFFICYHRFQPCVICPSVKDLKTMLIHTANNDREFYDKIKAATYASHKEIFDSIDSIKKESTPENIDKKQTLTIPSETIEKNKATKLNINTKKQKKYKNLSEITKSLKNRVLNKTVK